jgi:FixJ family two-component response regulator
MNRAALVAIIDDDEGVRTSLRSLVRSLGYDARCYDSATGFLADQRAGDPACIISDIQMPAMSGDELQATLLAAGRRIPMIFLTAFPVEATRARVMAAGATAHLQKPVDGATLAHCLATAIGQPPA